MQSQHCRVPSARRPWQRRRTTYKASVRGVPCLRTVTVGVGRAKRAAGCPCRQCCAVPAPLSCPTRVSLCRVRCLCGVRAATAAESITLRIVTGASYTGSGFTATLLSLQGCVGATTLAPGVFATSAYVSNLACSWQFGPATPNTTAVVSFNAVNILPGDQLTLAVVGAATPLVVIRGNDSSTVQGVVGVRYSTGAADTLVLRWTTGAAPAGASNGWNISLSTAPVTAVASAAPLTTAGIVSIAVAVPVAAMAAAVAVLLVRQRRRRLASGWPRSSERGRDGAKASDGDSDGSGVGDGVSAEVEVVNPMMATTNAVSSATTSSSSFHSTNPIFSQQSGGIGSGAAAAVVEVLPLPARSSPICAVAVSGPPSRQSSTNSNLGGVEPHVMEVMPLPLRSSPIAAVTGMPPRRRSSGSGSHGSVDSSPTTFSRRVHGPER